MSYSYVVIFFGIAALMGIASYRRGDFSYAQMLTIRRRAHIHDWPCTSHWGWWSDLLVLPWAMGIITYQLKSPNYSPLLWTFPVALLATVLAHHHWFKSGPPDHNIDWIRLPPQRRISSTQTWLAVGLIKKRLTPAGWTHLVYMGLVINLALDFFFGKGDIDHSAKIWVGLILCLHVTLSTLALDAKRGNPLQGAMLMTGITWLIFFICLAI